MNLKPYAKAVVGFLVPGVVALIAALSDGTVTTTEWLTIVLAAVGAGGAVYAVPNRPATMASGPLKGNGAL